MSEKKEPQVPETAPDLDAHARAKGGGRGRKGLTAVREARIAHIEGLMRTLQFRTGKTVIDLAKRWRLSLGVVKRDASEASRRVRASVMDDRDHITATVGAALDAALRGAIKDRQWRAVASLAKSWAEISGTAAPTRTEHTGRDGSAIVFDLTGITTEQMRAALAEDDAGDEGGAPSADAGGTGAPSGSGSEPA